MESKHWTQDEVNYLVKNYLDKKPTEMAADLNRPIESVKSKLSRLGLRKTQVSTENNFNKKSQVGKGMLRGNSKKKEIQKIAPVMIPVRIDHKTTIYIKSGENPEEARIKYIERTTKPQTY